MTGDVEINLQELVRLQPLSSPPPLEEDADRDQHQPQHEEGRHDEKEHNPHVRVRVQPERIGKVHEQEQHGADRGQRQAKKG